MVVRKDLRAIPVKVRTGLIALPLGLRLCGPFGEIIIALLLSIGPEARLLCFKLCQIAGRNFRIIDFRSVFQNFDCLIRLCQAIRERRYFLPLRAKIGDRPVRIGGERQGFKRRRGFGAQPFEHGFTGDFPPLGNSGRIDINPRRCRDHVPKFTAPRRRADVPLELGRNIPTVGIAHGVCRFIDRRFEIPVGLREIGAIMLDQPRAGQVLRTKRTDFGFHACGNDSDARHALRYPGLAVMAEP